MRESEYVKNITKKNQGACSTLILNENTYVVLLLNLKRSRLR